MTDWRERCAELEGLLTKLHEYVHADGRFLLDEDSGAGVYGVELDISIDESLTRTRAALAQPEPVGPSVEQMYYWALKAIRRYGLDTLSGRADGGADDREWQRAAVVEMVRRAQNALDYGGPGSRPAIEPEATDEELETTARAAEIQYMEDHGGLTASTLDGVHAQLQAQRLAGLRAVATRFARPAIKPVPSSPTNE